MGSFAPRGHAHLDPQKPAAFAICEKCGFLYNHRDLRWDKQWRGTQLVKTGHLVCPKCEDVPNRTLQAMVLPADPVPVLNPRPETPEVYVPSVAFAALPPPVLNLTAWVNDSRTRKVGVIVTGGGSFKVPVVYNGTNWVVAA
jgi:hypothetical protein